MINIQMNLIEIFESRYKNYLNFYIFNCRLLILNQNFTKIVEISFYINRKTIYFH